jgi:hypothetical protein
LDVSNTGICFDILLVLLQRQGLRLLTADARRRSLSYARLLLLGMFRMKNTLAREIWNFFTLLQSSAIIHLIIYYDNIMNDDPSIEDN